MLLLEKYLKEVKQCKKIETKILLVDAIIMFSSISFASIRYEVLVTALSILVNGEKINTNKPVVIDEECSLLSKIL